ncbi:sensor histidine kinase [Sediminivirga luteola]|uniref:histidine kinase n=1 Tax=Sediminivirga luteola TaxID=1774748 RepID=A0A8J2TW61_9MICO|nr:HAMP domain-containing sensor histidine kinase [Sediminivirga luteola]GGA06287.1 hypothetical protein GCM10011333_06550 [Sediminivirga luteola]
MADYLVIEIQIWLFLLIILGLVSGGAVGAYYLWRHLRDRERRIAGEAAEEAAAEHMVRRNRMLIRLDHELKNPLTAVRTSGATLRELVRDPTVSPQEIAASLDAMDAASRRVARLLADLRRLADVETRSIDFAPVDMETLVNQAVEDARTAPGAEGRTIVATVARAPWRLPPVAGEEDLLLSAVLNLLSNAVKYSGPEDVVEVRANEQVLGDHRWVVVEVADTGAGIPQSEQRAVFDELSRGTGGRWNCTRRRTWAPPCGSSSRRLPGLQRDIRDLLPQDRGRCRGPGRRRQPACSWARPCRRRPSSVPQ